MFGGNPYAGAGGMTLQDLIRGGGLAGNAPSGSNGHGGILSGALSGFPLGILPGLLMSHHPGAALAMLSPGGFALSKLFK